MRFRIHRKLPGLRWFGWLSLAVLGSLPWPAAPANPAGERALVERPAYRAEERFRILWRDPGDVSTRDLFYGIGGKQHAPQTEEYTFVEEDRGGNSPKFDVRDSKGVLWKVKLGPEAQGEVAATRLVFAAGYFADEDYFQPRIHVDGMPIRLKRDKHLVFSDGIVKNARMERQIEGQKKVGYWKWTDRRILNQRNLNGLKTVMALINNWDLKDTNTAIYKRPNAQGEAEYIYAVSDLGASFGLTHLDRQNTKANLQAYEASEFIAKADPKRVTLATPGAPTPYLMVNLEDYFYRRGLRSITRDIPRSDARWIGQILSGLSREQIRDTFRAAGFSQEETEGYATVVEQRIEILRQL